MEHEQPGVSPTTQNLSSPQGKKPASLDPYNKFLRWTDEQSKKSGGTPEANSNQNPSFIPKDKKEEESYYYEDY